jgi:hypothetical protein
MTPHAGPPRWGCAEARIALGVYVLGAIDPAERVLVDAHLATCDACQAELAELDGLPALLALVPAEEAIALAEGLPGDDLIMGPPPAITLPGGLDWARFEQPEDVPLELPRLAMPGPGGRPPAREQPGAALSPQARPEPVATVHDLAAARRRRRQGLTRAVAVAAAAVVIGAASFGGVKLAGPRSSPQASADQEHPNGQPMSAWATVRGGNGQATATVAYRSMGWGTQLDALVTGIPINTNCGMFVVERNGTRVQVGAWDTDAAEGTVWYPASVDVPASNVKAFVITVAGGKDITVTPA